MARSTILIVDKEKMLVDLLTRALSSADIEALGTTSADEALRLLELHAPALVVVDLSIPNGFSLLDAAARAKTKALAVSPSADIAERARAAGLRDVVDRSAGFEVLVDAIRRLLDTPLKVGSSNGIPILVTDDEEQIRNVLVEFLTTKGYSVRTGANGSEAVRIVNEDPSLQVVLLDVSMPEMGGMEALRYIMQRDNPPSVIMMTAVADRDVARQALKTGAFDYILKPFDFASLETSLTACLGHREYKKQPWWKRLANR